MELAKMEEGSGASKPQDFPSGSSPLPLLGPAPEETGCSRSHYSQRSPWLRALVLGANDGLVSIASLILGVSAVKGDQKTAIYSGIAGLVAGACSMAIGEFLSVFSQWDTELADLEKEAAEHLADPARELQELTLIYVGRGLSFDLARRVAEELSQGDVVKVHARDELGIDLDDLANPFQASSISAAAFSAGGLIPLLGGAFIKPFKLQIMSTVISSCVGLAAFGALGAFLGGASMLKGGFRVTFGGCIAMAATYAVLYVVSLISHTHVSA